jgi:hypothetical protein
LKAGRCSVEPPARHQRTAPDRISPLSRLLGCSRCFEYWSSWSYLSYFSEMPLSRNESSTKASCVQSADATKVALDFRTPGWHCQRAARGQPSAGKSRVLKPVIEAWLKKSQSN